MGRLQRWFRLVLATVITAALSVTAMAGTAAAKGQQIDAADFAIHSFTTDPQVPTGSIRLNCFPQWRQVEKKKGTYNWAPFDAALARAEAWGFSDIMYVFCGTPKWAGSKVKDPKLEVMGKGSTSAPDKIRDWKNYVNAVVKRYGDRIDSYQIWNEITSRQFYQGTVKDMAKMTKEAARIIRKKSGADVVSASVQTHVPSSFKKVAFPYFEELRKRNWPVDIISGHFYPAGKGGPDERVAQIEMFQQALKDNKAPKSKPRWDTEANFWTSVKGNPKAGRVTGTKAATYLARNYLDTWRTGLERSYWYLWSDERVSFPGVQLRIGDPATKAYTTIGEWLTGAKYKGCKEKEKLVTCAFSKDGDPLTIAFTTKGKETYTFKGTKTRCLVTGAACSTVKKKMQVGTIPVRIS